MAHDLEDDGPLVTKNRTGTEHCRTCCNTGWASVGTSAAGTEQMAPCPFCEEGRRMELAHYPLPGYWQGRLPKVEQLCRCGEKIAPPDQGTLERFRAMLEAAGRQVVGLSPEAMRSAMEKVSPTTSGRCDDCGAEAERVRFGSFQVCDSCVRMRLAAQAAIERSAAAMRDRRGDDVPLAQFNGSVPTTEGGTSADPG